jgi:hypothetical protein
LILVQVIDVVDEAFCSAIPKNHEQARNIPANCKTLSGVLNGVGTLVNNADRGERGQHEKPGAGATPAGLIDSESQADASLGCHERASSST